MELLKAAAAVTGACCPSCTASKKQLMALEGEMDGLVCKLNGFQRALQDCELELAERDLQVVLLKSFIGHMDNHPSELELNLQKVLQHNSQMSASVQQQQLLLSCADSTAAAAGPESAPSTAVQVSLLRAALAEANYRLAAAGLTPVAATTLQDTASTTTAQASSSAHGTQAHPALSYSRFLHKYNTATPTTDDPRTSSTSTSTGNSSKKSLPYTQRMSSTSCATSSTSPPATCAPALSLLAPLPRPYTATPAGRPGTPSPGPDTPAGLDCPPSVLTPASMCTTRTDSAHQHTSPPAPTAAVAPFAAAAAAAASAVTVVPQVPVAANLDEQFSAAAAAIAAETPLSALQSAGGLSCMGGHSTQIAFGDTNLMHVPAFETAAISLQTLGGTSRSSSRSSSGSGIMIKSRQLPDSQLAASTATISPLPSFVTTAASCNPPSAAGTPPCSPCSSISCGSTPARRSFAAAMQLPGVHRLPDVMCSCDNPLFASEEGEEF